VGGKLFHVGRRTDRQTDTIKLIVAFCNFANAPKSGWAGGLATSRFAGGAGVNVVLLALFTVTFSPSKIL
jgi:hypothetical protein